MEKCYTLDAGAAIEKQSNEVSFVGGVPHIPESTDLPQCTLCGSQQSFFFQVAFPHDHQWHGLSLAVFACTSCSDENHLIPEMLKGTLRGANIPTDFLSEYQTNFRFVIFETNLSSYRTSYSPRIKFIPLTLKPSKSELINKNKIGGVPNWLLEDESPATYGSREMFFLLQLKQGFRFPLLPNAPKQVRIGFSGKPEASPHDYYQLFISNNLYLFGTNGRENPNVYVLTQI